MLEERSTQRLARARLLQLPLDSNAGLSAPIAKSEKQADENRDNYRDNG
jgi:hypothetical protein